MKWFNKDRTVMIDLEQVASFQYDRTEINGHVYLRVNVAGQTLGLYDDEAREVYNKLTSDKQVI